MANTTWKVAGPLWKIRLEAPHEAAADCLSTALGEVAEAIAAFETTPGGAWQISGFIEGDVDHARLNALFAVAAMAAGIDEPSFIVERVAAQDWVKLNQESFPPLRIGRFFVYGSHIKETVPAGAIGLLIEAASAFGTGDHATTAGCLLALEQLAKRTRPTRILDMGTGTGILAIAAAKLWSTKVLAADLDPNSVRVAQENAAKNRVGRYVQTLVSDGYAAPAISAGGPYNLICANILARPLARMAPDLAAHLAPGGHAVLSGLLAAQERYVQAAHLRNQLEMVGRIARDGWHTLIYRKPYPSRLSW